MGLGQTILSIFSLVLLSRLLLSINTTTLDVGFLKDISEYRITGTSLGTSMMEKVNGLAFDEATTDSALSPSNKSLLTASASFGPESGESNPTLYDDIDDYQNYVETDSLENSAIFKVKVHVDYYTSTASAFSITTTKGFSKLITVYVTSDFLVDYTTDPPQRDTLKFYSVYSYWSFR